MILNNIYGSGQLLINQKLVPQIFQELEGIPVCCLNDLSNAYV